MNTPTLPRPSDAALQRFEAWLDEKAAAQLFPVLAWGSGHTLIAVTYAHELVARALREALGDDVNGAPQASSRVVDALRGMVGFVQLMQYRYEDFPVDNHRVIEAQSALNSLEGESENGNANRNR